MTFFIAAAKDRDQAEIVWAVVRASLHDRGLPTSRRRIRALAWEGGGEVHYLAVGADTGLDEGWRVIDFDEEVCGHA